jgi:hypothetical protein
MFAAARRAVATGATIAAVAKNTSQPTCEAAVGTTAPEGHPPPHTPFFLLFFSPTARGVPASARCVHLTIGSWWSPRESHIFFLAYYSRMWSNNHNVDGQAQNAERPDWAASPQPPTPPKRKNKRWISNLQWTKTQPPGLLISRSTNEVTWSKYEPISTPSRSLTPIFR